jgi:hypothetical protein
VPRLVYLFNVDSTLQTWQEIRTWSCQSLLSMLSMVAPMQGTSLPCRWVVFWSGLWLIYLWLGQCFSLHVVLLSGENWPKSMCSHESFLCTAGVHDSSSGCRNICWGHEDGDRGLPHFEGVFLVLCNMFPLEILLLRLCFQSGQFPLGNQILLKKCFAPSDVTGCSYGHTPNIISTVAYWVSQV